MSLSDHSTPTSSSHSKRRETEEERSIRKEKERKAREIETEEERKTRKEKERLREEERQASKNGRERRKETEEERRIRKEKEASGRRRETESERAIRKEKEKRERENETEEERRIRKEKEREKEEERRLRKEREKSSSWGKKETEEKIVSHKESKEGLQIKCEENKIKIETLELDEDYFLKEEAKLASKNKDIKKKPFNDKENNRMKEEPMEESDGHIPLAQLQKSHVHDSGDDSDVPLAKRKEKVKKRKAAKKNEDNVEDENEIKPTKRSKTIHDAVIEDKNNNKKSNKERAKGKVKETDETKPTKKMTKKEKELEEEKNVWKWWEEKDEDGNLVKKKDDGTKWKFLEHKGPLLAPEYEPLPPDVKFWYDGKIMRLSEATEEVCTFYGKMLDHDYTTKEVFNKNFFNDWKKIMTKHEREKIKDLSKCDFSEINEHFKKIGEERKARSKEAKLEEKEKNAKIQAEFGVCTLDGHQEKIGNYRVEPPGLFRGRGEHPKQGMVKLRVPPEDIIINCSKNSKYPDPPPGHKWKEIRHDNTVTWLASWTENVQGQIKYVMLNPSSKLKAEKDVEKYQKARDLKLKIDDIRKDYEGDMTHDLMQIRQRAVALYFIDKLALRAGNEKDEDQADTVGCCSLRVEHVELFRDKDDKEYCVEFDFLGKDSIRYFNSVDVTKRVWKNIEKFKRNKKEGDDLFDRLNTSTLNTYLNTLMPGLTAKVFRTYNASITLQEQLEKLTEPEDNVSAKMLSYNRANREVALLCNHQRAVPKTHDKSMANLDEKIEKKKEAIKEAEKLFKAAKKTYKSGEDKNKEAVEKKKKAIQRLLEQMENLEIQKTDKDENKTIALGTSKLNYLDPRISVAWCKKHDVPIEKVYNKTQRQKFMWAINMAGHDYVF